MPSAHGSEPVTEPRERGLRRRAVLLARGLAAAADALQILLFPLFGEGFASPADWILDGLMALLLTKLVGFHWSYLPGAALELVPGADLAPSWTAAAWLATRGEGGAGKEPRWWLAIAAGVVALAAAIAWIWFHRPS